MTWLALIAYAAFGAALAWGGLSMLRRRYRRKFHCIAPYVPTEARSAATTRAPS